MIQYSLNLQSTMHKFTNVVNFYRFSHSCVNIFSRSKEFNSRCMRNLQKYTLSTLMWGDHSIISIYIYFQKCLSKIIDKTTSSISNTLAVRLDKFI